MTDAQLHHAFLARRAAMAAFRTLPWRPLGTLAPAERAAADRAAAESERLDAAIVAELRRRGRPAPLGAIALHLTKDADAFVAVDADGLITPRPDRMTVREHRYYLFDYTRPIDRLPMRRGVAS